MCLFKHFRDNICIQASEMLYFINDNFFKPSGVKFYNQRAFIHVKGDP